MAHYAGDFYKRPDGRKDYRAAKSLCECGHTKDKHGKQCRARVVLPNNWFRPCECICFRESK